MNIRLDYLEQGEGEALILLHGNGESKEYFEHQLPFFSGRFHVYALDTRGHGGSPRGTAPFTLAQFAEDLKAFMDERRIRRANLLGFSDGGNIALLFALKYPERVRRLVLNGANLSPKGVKLSVQLPIVLGYGLCRLIECFDRGAKAKRELLGLMVTQPKLRPEELGGLPMPVLVIAGKNDMIRDSHTRAIHRAVPGSSLAILEGDHFVANKNSGAFNAAVMDFLMKK